MKKEDRLENLKYNKYQRDISDVQQGHKHWEMVSGKKQATLTDFITTIFRRGSRSPGGDVIFSPDRLSTALDKTAAKNTLYAYVNRNRWVADCPCGGAEVVDENDLFMYCFSCQNEGNSGKLYKVVFPKKVDKNRIEAALKERNKVINRNWNLDETPAKLEKENTSHIKDVN